MGLSVHACTSQLSKLFGEQHDKTTHTVLASAAHEMAFVYLLRTTDAGRARTYVGATTNLGLRLRQHNGERSGGARQTRGRAWTMMMHVEGFPTWRDALRFEYAWRRIGARQVHGRGIDGRLDALGLLVARERWSSTSPPACDVPLRLVARADLLARLRARLQCPSHVSICADGSRARAENAADREVGRGSDEASDEGGGAATHQESAT